MDSNGSRWYLHVGKGAYIQRRWVADEGRGGGPAAAAGGGGRAAVGGATCQVPLLLLVAMRNRRQGRRTRRARPVVQRLESRRADRLRAEAVRSRRLQQGQGGLLAEVGRARADSSLHRSRLQVRT